MVMIMRRKEHVKPTVMGARAIKYGSIIKPTNI